MLTKRGRRNFAAVACDLDRTITDSRLHVVPKARARLRFIRGRGVKTILVTGRSLSEFSNRGSLLREFDEVVLESGAILLAHDQGKALCRSVAPIRQVRRWLMDQGIRHRLGQASISIASSHREAIRECPALKRVQAHENRDRIDLTPLECDKGTGLLKALARLAIPGQSCLAFGDANNDLPAFRVVGYSVAVGNAEPALKQAAHEVAPGYGGRAVARFLRERFLIE